MRAPLRSTDIVELFLHGGREDNPLKEAGKQINLAD
jgi:hypothetical protein